MTKEIKDKNRVRFDNWSKVYDRSILQNMVFNRSHNLFFKEMVSSLKEGARVLDVGCGTGKFAFRLADLRKDLKICGMDLSQDMIKKAEMKLSGENIEFKIGDVEDLPYESNTFDIITCSNSFHHYPNQERAIKEMHRVLNSEGRLMIIDGSRDNLLGKLIFGVVEMVEGEVYHIFEKELKNMLMNTGFDDVIQRTFNPIAPLLFTSGQAKKEGENK